MDTAVHPKSSAHERLLVEEEAGPTIRRGQVAFFSVVVASLNHCQQVPTFFSALAMIKSTVGVGVFALPYAM